MNFIKSIFTKKAPIISNNKEFWEWFSTNANHFFKVIKNGKNIEKDFFGPLSGQLAQLKDGYFYLTGMFNTTTAELILTADGAIENIVFIEELVKDAPQIGSWKFTALKPEMKIEDVRIDLGGFVFADENLFFYVNEHAYYPDEIDIDIVYSDYDDESSFDINSGVYLFLDNYLGELNAITTIDNLKIASTHPVGRELIPIHKLKAYLIWREKEFVEKYEGIRHNSENDTYSTMNATLQNDRPLVAVVNTTLMDWDAKASHPWILNISIGYPEGNNNGLPDSETYDILNDIEDELNTKLIDFEGYLNVARQSANHTREIYFACKEFRKPSKVVHEFSKTLPENLELNYSIYKDKYWQSMERFSSKV